MSRQNRNRQEPPDDFRYDAFISYSRKDGDWVRQTLLPRLEGEGLRVCIDTRDFEVGAPSLVNMENAVEHSRKTLLVLTPAWVASQWTAFESLLLQTKDPAGRARRILPLLLKPCRLPGRLKIFTSLDLTDPAQLDAQMGRLVAAIGPSPTPDQAASGTPTTTREAEATNAPNPFGDTGRIADPARFFDREELLRQVFEELGKGANVSLVGDSQVGKSSLLEMVRALGPERLGRPPGEFAYVSLEWVDDEAQFYCALCDTFGIAECRGYPFFRALRDRRIVLCLDEIEKMAWDGFSVHVRSQLRGLADGPAMPLKLVIASRSPLSRLFPDSPELDSPLAGICRQVDVGPLSPAAARTFLADRLRGTGVAFGEGDVSRLLAESKGHPAELQRAAADLYRRLAQDATHSP